MSKKLLAAVLALSLIASLLFVPAAAATTFDDVAADHWASSSIERWADYGVLTGHGDGTFTPDVVMTRAEFATMLVKMLGLTAKSESSFTDVTDHWAAEFISIAVKAGIINGVGDNKFDPDEPVSFEQAAVMMCRAFGLAKNTSGDDWSKESIEKLTSLGMIGEGADEHLQVGVECNRAVVAKLADTMVAEYVAEDRATPITGEVKGVVLVVKGAKAEIKDATLVAPVVAESASVTLTNTKADAVIVSGKDAAVTADEQSTVASVTLAGEAPKADIKGEVASVIVAEETTGAVIEAPKADENAIVNNSGTDITVNGETVSNKADDAPNNPTDTTTGDSTATEQHKHTWGAATPDKVGNTDTWNGSTHTKACRDTTKCTAKTTEACTITYTVTTTQHTKKCSVCGGQGTAEDHDFGTTGKCVCGMTLSAPENEPVDASHTHTWVANEAEDAGNVAATCTKEGLKVYKCTAKKTVPAPTEENPNATKEVACGEVMTEVIPKTAHTYGAEVVDKEATCTTTGSKHKTCNVCGYTVNETIAKSAHTYTDGVYTYMGPDGHKQTCTRCGQQQSTAVAHDWTDNNGICKDCDYTCAHTGEKTYEHVADSTTHKVICGTCGKVLETVDCDKNVTSKAAVAATCTAKAKTAELKCSKCDAVTQAQEETGDALGHDPADLSTLCPGQTCSRCDAVGTGSHTWGADDAAGTECTKCHQTKPAS